MPDYEDLNHPQVQGVCIMHEVEATRAGFTEVKIMRDILAGILVPIVVLSVSQNRPSGAGPVAAVNRVLHFPGDQCLGTLSIEDGSSTSEFLRSRSDPSWPWLDPRLVDLHVSWERLGVAQGDVTFPAGQDVALHVALKLTPSEAASQYGRDRHFPDPQDLTGLSGLDPNDLGMLFVNSPSPKAYADERVVGPLSRLTGLKMLQLNRTGVTDKGMEHIRNLRRLRSLELAEPRVGDAGVAVLKDLPELAYLDIETATTDTGFRQIGQLPSLRWLRIRMGKIRGPGLAELATLPRLERLSLWGSAGLTDRHVKYLEGLTHLKSLTLWGAANPPLTDASLASIAKLDGLEELYFVRLDTRFTAAGIAHLKNLKNLKTVDFGSQSIDDAGLRHLAGVPGLTAIKGGVQFTADTAGTLASSRDLKSLEVRLADRDTRGAVASLSALTSLEELSIFGPFEPGRAVSTPEITENLAGLEPLGRLKRLSLWNDELTDRDMASIGKLRQMESLHLAARTVTKRGLNQLNGLANLQTLSVKSGLGIAASGGVDEAPLNLSACANLKTAQLSGLSLQDADAVSLAGLRRLEWLNLSGAFTEQTLLYLRDLCELRVLDIDGITCINGEGLTRLKGLDQLEDLTLRGRITDMALAQLPALRSLRSLTIETSEPIQAGTITRLTQTLPMKPDIHVRKPLPSGHPLIQSTPAPGTRRRSK